MTEAQNTKRIAEEANEKKARLFERKCNAYARKIITKINKHAKKGTLVVGLTLKKKYSNSIVRNYLVDRGYSLKVDCKNGRDFLTIRYN